MTLWVARAGRHGEQEHFALENGVIVADYPDLGDLSNIKSKDELVDMLRTARPNNKERTLKTWASSLWSFLKEMKRGDLVALPSKFDPVIYFGEITGEYQFFKDNPGGARHTRPVRWIKEVNRGDLDQDILNSFRSLLAIFSVRRNNAEQRIKNIIYKSQIIDFKNEENEQEYLFDTEDYSRDVIRRSIYESFGGHEFARLIGLILKAQGYHVYVSPPGPDGGVDILAGTGPLGFESPRIAVQVKSGQSQIGTPEIDQLRGVVKKFGADYGLFVSWGGYKQSIRRDMRQMWHEVRLWDSDDVIDKFLECYEKLPADVQSEIPLKRIWIPILDEE